MIVRIIRKNFLDFFIFLKPFENMGSSLYIKQTEWRNWIWIEMSWKN